MVKVKASDSYTVRSEEDRFNHPMVKVKVIFKLDIHQTFYCFNHPMVKVKGRSYNPARKL